MLIPQTRIAFLISAQHLIAHGGIGQFAKGFCELLPSNQIDIITDKAPPDTDFVRYLGSLPNVSFIEPLEPSGYKKHTQTHAFSESLNLERISNFRDSLMRAFQTRIYDSIIINTPEALFSTYALGIQEYCQIIFYTHNENLVFKNNPFAGVFNDSYDEMISQVMRSKDILVATQTTRNLDELVDIKNKVWLPMPLPERDLLTPSADVNKSGVLFIGRWEDRKNPKEYLRVIAETGLPAKVMTNDNGAKQFEKALKDIGVDYDIKVSITGSEKVNFIKSSKVFYMPSKSESYGFALMETIGHTNAVVLGENHWHRNFDSRYITLSSKKDVVSDIKRLYNQDVPLSNLDYVRELDHSCRSLWSTAISKFSSKKSASDAANINRQSDIFYGDFIKSLNRFASIEDVISVLGNRYKFTVSHTKDGSYLSKTGKLAPVKKETTIIFDDIF